ncbi:MAG: DUF423 domain-containing protein [Reyranella sp.]|nr:MAG: DUF423 domain-containing protein [Reyranella sp.]
MGKAAARGWIVVAALSAALAIAIGAFAAHGIDVSTPAGLKAREWLHTGSQYEMIHALAILAVAALAHGERLGGRTALAAQWLFLIGSVFFPGALYALAFGGPKWFGAVAPIGGTAFILGWICLAAAALLRKAARP